MTKDRSEIERAKRAERFASGVYGQPGKAVLRDGPWHEMPASYTKARKTARFPHMFDAIENWDSKDYYRCFFTGVLSPPLGTEQEATHPRQHPWRGTKDHLVPARRRVGGSMLAQGRCPVDVTLYPSSMLWCSAVANDSLGVVPLPVRVTVRRWLAASNYNRADISVAAGENMRWLIVSMLDHFRLSNGRLFWSRDSQGNWWDVGMQEPIMRRCYDLEEEFLRLDNAEREAWISVMPWRF